VRLCSIVDDIQRFKRGIFPVPVRRTMYQRPGIERDENASPRAPPLAVNIRHPFPSEPPSLLVVHRQPSPGQHPPSQGVIRYPVQPEPPKRGYKIVLGCPVDDVVSTLIESRSYPVVVFANKADLGDFCGGKVGDGKSAEFLLIVRFVDCLECFLEWSCSVGCVAEGLQRIGKEMGVWGA
jgi:hypothetical protein